MDLTSQDEPGDPYTLIKQPPIAPYRDPVPAVVQPERQSIHLLCQQFGESNEGDLHNE